MKKILVVEDSALVAKVIQHVLGQSELIQPLYAETFAAARAIIDAEGSELFAALVDLNLPDAPDGEVVDFTLSKNLPTVVLTGSFDSERRQQLLSKGVVDYVTKEGRYSYRYVAGLLHRLIRNEDIQVLVVDDSSTMRKHVSALLRLHRYQVLEACDGLDAIRCVLDNPGISLMITDFNMPRMDGCELIKAIRGKYEKSDLVIIGLSSASDEALSAKFIKSGANDFLRKPFNHEEFFCRVSHNVEMLEMIGTLRDAANRDYYTGAYNRHYFFATGANLLAQSLEKNVPVAAVTIDLDNFKEINQHYGNAVGDEVMRAVAKQLMRLCDRFLLARADGQEFYLLLVGLDNEKACAFVGRVRQIISGTPFNINGVQIGITFSAGVANSTHNDLDQLIRAASECLQRAKEAGGDLVFGNH
jgi:diguanylate cyclase (GGDEF)-like protein